MNNDLSILWSEFSVFAWLADVSLQAALVLGPVWLLARFGSAKMSASKRHTLLATGLLSVPLLMVASLWVPGWGFEVPSKSPAIADHSIRVRSTDGADRNDRSENAGEVAAAGQAAVAPVPAVDFDSRSGLFLSVWLGGILVFGLSACYSAWRLRCLRLQANLIRVGRRANLLDSLRSEFKISEQRNILLLESGANSMPMTWGWRNPVVLLPIDSGEWSDARLLLVLRHELAHVVRADSATSLAGFLCASLLWFHPLAWLACRKLWQMREQACDDHVLVACKADPASYAEELLAAVRGIGSPSSAIRLPALAMATAMSPSGSRNLKERVHAVLAEGRQRSGFGGGVRGIAIPLWLVAVIGLAGLSACRKHGTDPDADEGLPEGWARRIFLLTDQQWQRLSGGQDLFQTINQDPFADPSAQKQLPSHESLRSAALAVRSRLINEGVDFEFSRPEDAALAVSLSDPRTLVVCGREALLSQVAEILLSYSDTPQIRIQAHVFRVPTDFSYRDDISVVDASTPSGSVTGVVDAETAKALLTRVENTEGVEIVARPVVVTGSSVRANIEVGRELIYPTEYDPPEIPQQIGSDAETTGAFPVTPANPAAFETRNVGLAMKLLPDLRRDGKISLDLSFEQINFEGFINYGSPIHAAVELEETGEAVPVVLTDNRIEMPVFTSSKYDSSLVSSPEDWIVIGGMGESENYGAADVDFDPDSGKRKSDSKQESVKSILLFFIKADLIE